MLEGNCTTRRFAIALLSTLALAGSSSSADTLTLSISQGTEKKGEKQFGLEYSAKIYGPFHAVAGIGALPLRDFLAAPYAGYFATGLAMDIEVPYIYGRVSHSAAVVFPTSSRFRTYLQWFTQAGAGLWLGDFRLGIAWRHLSNGTTYKNVGHDYIGFDLGWRL